MPIGVAQAKLLGARLRELPFRFDTFLASPLTRARQTARVIASEIDGPSLALDPELEECTPPTWRTDVVADETAASLAACKHRLDSLFKARFRPSPDHEHRELWVCHGNVIRYLVTEALGVDTRAWLEMSVGNASLTEIRVEPDGRFKVISVGDVGHLPPALQTGATGDPDRDLALPVEPSSPSR